MARFTTLTALNVNDAIPDAWVDEVKAAHDYMIVPGADLASAATINPTSEWHKVTGSVTIDNITDSAGASVGQQVRLWFTGAPLVRNNGGGSGNIRTDSGSDLQIVANDIVVFVFDGTVWREQNGIVNGDFAGTDGKYWARKAGVWQAIQGASLALGFDSYVTADGTGAYTMSGFSSVQGVNLTPVFSGRVLFQCTWLSVGSISATKWMFGTGSAPANHAAVTGTQFGHELTSFSGTQSDIWIITGLTVGTNYWFDLAYNAGAGAPRFKSVCILEL